MKAKFLLSTATALAMLGSIGLASAQSTPPPSQTNPPRDAASSPTPSGSPTTPEMAKDKDAAAKKPRSDTPSTMSDPAGKGTSRPSDTSVGSERPPKADRN